MMRGNNRKRIYEKNRDKAKLLDIMMKIKEATGFKLLAYCIMDNHIHLLLKEEENLSNLMKKINLRYAAYFNTKYNKIGHVFQDRFRSEPVEDDRYLLCLMRYIHNNPVEAKMTKEPEEYKWSSYNDYISKSSIITDVDFIIDMFSIEGKGFLIEEFKKYHKIHDDNTYLEGDRYKKEIEEEKGWRLVEDYFRDKSGIKDINKLELKEKVIEILVSKTKLSQRKIAEMMEVNRETVRKVSKAMDK